MQNSMQCSRYVDTTSATIDLMTQGVRTNGSSLLIMRVARITQSLFHSSSTQLHTSPIPGSIIRGMS